jgi:hypothetical protein
VLVPTAVVGLIAVKVQVSYIQITAAETVPYPCPEPQRQGQPVARLAWGSGSPVSQPRKVTGRSNTA